MKRVALTSAALLCCLALAPAAFAQASKAGATTTPAQVAHPPPQSAIPPPVRARMATPVKGTAFIEVIQGQSKTVGKDVVTVTRVKNVSNAPIAGLRIDEYWYDKRLAQVSGTTERVRAPIAAGEIVEITTKSPTKPDLYKSQQLFSHANGKINAKAVKKFTDDKK